MTLLKCSTIHHGVVHVSKNAYEVSEPSQLLSIYAFYEGEGWKHLPFAVRKWEIKKVLEEVEM